MVFVVAIVVAAVTPIAAVTVVTPIAAIAAIAAKSVRSAPFAGMVVPAAVLPAVLESRVERCRSVRPPVALETLVGITLIASPVLVAVPAQWRRQHAEADFRPGASVIRRRVPAVAVTNIVAPLAVEDRPARATCDVDADVGQPDHGWSLGQRQKQSGQRCFNLDRHMRECGLRCERGGSAEQNGCHDTDGCARDLHYDVLSWFVSGSANIDFGNLF